MEFTAQQQKAIDERGKTLLVSAAAGSGKTATLTERIIRSITDKEKPVDVSRLLVVTFTVAAAGEMKARITNRLTALLSEDPSNRRISDQLMMLGSAQISTLDSFYLELVRNNFEAAGFPPDFRVCDEGELFSLQRQLMNRAIDRMYREEPDFPELADLFSDIRQETALCERLLGIRAELCRIPEGIDILLRSGKEMAQCADSPFDSTFGQVLCRELSRYQKAGTKLLTRALAEIESEEKSEDLRLKFGPLYSEALHRFEEIGAALVEHDYERARLSLAPFSARVGLKRPKTSAEFDRLKNTVSLFLDSFKKFSSLFFPYTKEELTSSAGRCERVLLLLHRTLSLFEEAYRAAKMTREIAEFSDVSRAAYSLLVLPDGSPSPLALSMRDNYDAIYIDEYQDVDAMQDATLCAISKENNRFMVGDVKQSIYAFRGSDPDIFTAYRRKFPDLEAGKEGPAALFMSDCFRCDLGVVRFSNAVSHYLFSHHADSIAYRPEDDLVFRKRSDPGCLSAKTQVFAIDGQCELPEEESDGAEAICVVNEIRTLLKDGKKADGSPILPSDIAVLSRAEKPLKPVAKLLSSMGIPVNDCTRKNLFENPEVSCVYSLLSVLDNPYADVPLAATLRSPFFGFTLEELVKIRTAAKGDASLFEALESATTDGSTLSLKCRETLRSLALYREKATELPVDELLSYLYKETSVLSFYAGNKREEPTARRAHLLRLYEYARTFESGSFKGLYAFLAHLQSIMNRKETLKGPMGTGDAVRLMTIHGSKGLEFPVCMLIGCGANLGGQRKVNFFTVKEIGCATKLSNAGPFSLSDTFFARILRIEEDRKEREEEMRILYVGMTRARERLYLFGKPRAGLQKLREKVAVYAGNDTDFFKGAGSSYLFWTLEALQETEYEDFCEIHEIYELEPPRKEQNKAPQERFYDPQKEELARQRFGERFSFEYPYRHLSDLPAKLSVSRLSPEVLDIGDGTAAARPEDLLDPDVEALLHTFEQEPVFEAEEKPDAAKKGTATHEFLQFCDFKNAKKKGVEAELCRLIEKRFLPPDIREAVRLNELSAFFESDFYLDLAHAREIHRETRFNIFLPAASFTADPERKEQLAGEKLLVQGVIDLFFTDAKGGLVLCDYKTDRLPPEALQNPEAAKNFLFERHGEQLRYYREALRQICGRVPDRTLLYSLPLGRALEAPSGFFTD